MIDRSVRQSGIIHNEVKLSVAFALLFLAGCGGSNQSPSQEVPVGRIDSSTAAIIAGKVTFSGKPPVMPVLDMSANPACERLNKNPRRAEEVVVNPNGTLRNTLVWIESGLPEARWNPPADFAKLDQEGCVYEPHVLGLMVGQTLEISNSDTVNHNIHANGRVNEGWNVSEPPRAEKRTARFAKEEIMLPVTCGLHPWMRAYLAVVPHPFFAVTGDDGAFSIGGVPPGTYTLEAVHEKYGKRNLRITVAARETKGVEFSYAAEAASN
jgi:plastocyanin